MSGSPALAATRWPLDRLKPHPKNAEIYGDVADPELIQSIKAHGVLTPLTVTSAGIVVSGHRRLMAAQAAGLDEVPVTPFGSDDELDIVEALIESNRQRSKTGEQIGREFHALRWVMDTRDRRGRPSKNRVNLPRFSGKTREEIGKKLGVSASKAERAARVVTAIDGLAQAGKHQEAEHLRKVLNGRSVQRAYTEGQREGHITQAAVALAEAAETPAASPLILLSEDPAIPKLVTLPVWRSLTVDQQAEVLARPASRQAQFNWQQSDDIEWARWSWNPVTGCKHDCSYCYAREIAESDRMASAYPQKFVPTFLPERLGAPANTRLVSSDEIEREPARRNVFTCSMADLFGRWVPDEWIEAVMRSVRANPRWNFLFLTKFPQRLPDVDFPTNAWVGTTVDAQARVSVAEKAFEKVNAQVKWLSCEPLLEPLHFERLDLFNWIVIGGASANALTGTPAFRPPRVWVNDLWAQALAAGMTEDSIYEKTNLLERNRGMPGKTVRPRVDVPSAFKMRYLQRDILQPKAYQKEFA